MKFLDTKILAELSNKAAASPRLRAHNNFHPELNDPIQRLAIAMEPGTYVRPHRHPNTFEVLLPLSGELVVLYFDDQGTVTNRTLVGKDKTQVIEHPPGQWHAVASLSKGAVVFEVKTGPYQAPSVQDVAPWSPAEGTPEAASLVEWFLRAKVGERA